MSTLKIKISDLIIFVFWLTFFLHYLTDINFYLTAALWMGTGIFIFTYIYAEYPQYRNILNILIFVDLIAFLGLFVNGNHNPLDSAILPTTQGIGIYLYINRKQLKQCDYIALFFILYLTYKVYTLPKMLISDWQYGIKLSNLVGQNSVSILICTFLSIDLIHRKESNIRINYLFFALAMMAAIKCDGMGGILSIFLFITGVLIINKNKNRISWKRITLIILIFVAIVTYNNGWEKLLQQVTDDNSRFYIWSHYLATILNLKGFFFGGDVSGNSFLYKLGNMHNEVLNWHYYYGIIPTLFFLYMWARIIFYHIKKRDGTMLIIALITILRSMTDYTTYSLMIIWTFLYIQTYMEAIEDQELVIT